MLSRNRNRTQKKKLLIGTAVWLSALLLCAMPVVAQEEAVTAAEPVDVVVALEPMEAAPDIDEPVMPVLSGQSIQTISFRKDMPIKDALRMLAQMYQKNIVPSAKVDGIVTVSHLYDVTFEEALQAILGTHKYEAKGNFIKVYTNEEFMLDKSRFEYTSIPLYYVNAEKAKELATPLLSDFGRIGVTSPAEKGTDAGSGGDSLAIHDRLTLSDYPENINKIREMLAEVDVEPLQVLIEVTVMKATLNEGFEFGIDWTNIVNEHAAYPGFKITEFENIETGNAVFRVEKDQSLLSHRNGFSFRNDMLSIGLTIDSIKAAIEASESVSDTTLLANPKILALNKQAGMLHICPEEGYPVFRNFRDDGTQTQEVEQLISGTVLKFRPFIGRDGRIRMEIHPEQSAGTIVNNLPFKDTTQITTNVMVNDGQTIVLGGLFQEETTLGRNQVPLLGDIPFIGEAFKRTRERSVRTELIVLITPHIIHSPEQADGADRLEDVYRLAHNARKNIHGLSRVRWAEDRYSRAVQEYNSGNLEAALMELNCPWIISPRNHLDTIRLRERIFRQTQPGQWDSLKRIMLQKLEKEESSRGLRR